MSDGSKFLTVWIASAVVMLAAWLLQRRSRNAGLVDAVWAACMGAAALFYAYAGSGGLAARVATGVLGGLWGFRLSMHLLARVLSEPEDGRYRALRAHWRDSQLRFFLFFQAQAIAVAVFSLPFLAASDGSAATLTPAVAAAVLIWLVGLGGETLADLQLARFRRDADHQGRTCRDGLWRYSRHPNYFFEWLHWFSYGLLAIGAAQAWLAWTGPVLMLVALYRVSGIPFTEAQALRSRGEDYRRYQRETSPFVPWLPRRAPP